MYFYFVFFIDTPTSNLPTELIYADDCDFVNNDPVKTQRINEIVEETLKQDNLKVNTSKTEHTTIKRTNRNEESWRGVKKLGSLLGDSEDLTNRKTLANAAMNKIKNLWLCNKRISINKKIKIYNALVKPVLTYNSCTWGLTKCENDKLDAFHRTQLRKIWKRRFMSNKDVYKLSNSKPITKEIREQRWRMFGHCLRLNLETPAQKSMTYYFQEEPQLKKFDGLPKKTFPEIKLTKLKTSSDLQKAREIASNRDEWKKLSMMICSIA